MAAATYAGAQVTVYERSEPVVTYPAPVVTYSAPVVTYPAPVVTYPASEVYQARVISARAVSGGPQQRCWMEKQQIGPLELPGAIIGGTIDLLAGRQSTQYVQRCTNVASGTAYWDVTYEFRGVERTAQLSVPPGHTIRVNGYGEPIA